MESIIVRFKEITIENVIEKIFVQIGIFIYINNNRTKIIFLIYYIDSYFLTNLHENP